MTEKNFEVAVVGASLAGATLALQLGRLGIHTGLICSSLSHPAKPCGEGMSETGLRLLAGLDLGGRLEELPCSPLAGYSIHRGGRTAALRFERRTGVGVERRVLDPMIREAAAGWPSVELLVGKVRAAVVGGRSVVLGCEGRTVKARYLVLADGGNSVLASRFGIRPRGPGYRRYGCTAILEGAYLRPVDCVHVFIHRGYQAFCTPVSAGRLNVSLLSGPGGGSVLRDRARRVEAVAAAARLIGFSGSVTGEIRGSGPVGSRSRPPVWGGRVMLIGDCCEQFDPIGGVGMTHAVASAVCAAGALAEVLRQQENPAAALQRYAVRREAAARPLRGFTRLSYLLLAELAGLPYAGLLDCSAAARGAGRAVHGIAAGNCWSDWPWRLLLSSAGLKVRVNELQLSGGEL